MMGQTKVQVVSRSSGVGFGGKESGRKRYIKVVGAVVKVVVVMKVVDNGYMTKCTGDIFLQWVV